MKGIVIILGSPNDDEGNLSDISVGRLTKGLEEYKSNPGYKILCTGGFGDHFNRTDTPHAIYAVKYLKEQGIPEEDIIEIAKSHDTVEDAWKTKPIIDKYNVINLIIVSSDFHLDRVRFIFERIFSNYKIKFSEAQTNFSGEKYKVLYASEKGKIKRLQEEGVPGL